MITSGALLMLGALSACGSQPAATRSGQAAEHSNEPATELPVGLRVELEQRPASEPSVAIIAVWQDARGAIQRKELGSFVGRVVEGRPSDGELAAVTVLRRPGTGQRVYVTRGGGGVEVRAQPVGLEGDDDVLGRIALPGDARPVPREPSLEIGPRN